MNRATQRIFVGLALVLLFGLGTSVLATPAPAPVSRVFKLKAAGQIDPVSRAITFGGVATHLGLYTADGFLTARLVIFGTIEAANGDQLNFTGFFVPWFGELRATINLDGGTGRFADAYGTAFGPVVLNPDFTFRITVQGSLEY
jgi:hypothetical protein